MPWAPAGFFLGKIYRRSQDCLWRGALFFLKKVDDLFLVVALKTRAKTTE